MSEEKVQLLNTMCHHRIEVQTALQVLIHALEKRSLIHDASKFGADEFEGFSRINRAAREFPYGSDEYRAALRAEKPTIALHYSRNSHHPEYFTNPVDGECFANSGMGLLDLIEMVCDWHAAWRVYEGQRTPDKRCTWKENLDKQRERFSNLTEAQWYVIDEVAHLLELGWMR
jgi:hypothetical protein